MSVSGGLDSTVMAYYAKDNGHDIVGVPFHYGSKHNEWEGRALEQLDAIRAFPILPSVDLNSIYGPISTSSSLFKNDKSLPHGHYEEESMRQTVIPGRNLIFISILAAYAEARGFDEVWLGVHAGDHFIYPDCRPEFIFNVSAAVQKSTDDKVRVCAPFEGLTKVDIVKMGIGLKVPFNLTRTCYSNQRVACGKCGSCQERLTSFKANDFIDPLDYETREILPKKTVA